MNKDTFWELIHKAKEKCGQDMDAMANALKDWLVERGAEQAQAFHDILHTYEDLANRYGLWDAASIMKGWCSDDGFIDFRAWLIAQGKEVYLAALRDPDSLADIEVYGDCCFESLSYMGDYAYEQLTGQSAYENSDPDSYEKWKAVLIEDIVYRDDISFPRATRALPAAYPRICAKYGGAERFNIDEIGWNTDQPKIRLLLELGRLYDTKKKLKRRGGEAR